MADAGVNRSTWQWTAKKEAAALAFAEGKTWAQIHSDHAVATSTLALWVKVPEFQARIDEHIQEMIGEARRILQRHATQAAIKLASLLVYGLPGHNVQLAAAKDILDRAGLKAPERLEVGGKDGGPIQITVVYEEKVG